MDDDSHLVDDIDDIDFNRYRRGGDDDDELLGTASARRSAIATSEYDGRQHPVVMAGRRSDIVEEGFEREGSLFYLGGRSDDIIVAERSPSWSELQEVRLHSVNYF